MNIFFLLLILFGILLFQVSLTITVSLIIYSLNYITQFGANNNN